MKNPMSSKRHHVAGFTLVEALISAAIVGFVLAGVTGLLVLSLKFYYLNVDKLQADRDLRSLTDNLVKSGSNASFFRIYTSFTARTAADIIPLGSTGDMVVFAYYNPATSPAGDVVYRIVCYYQQAAADGTFPIRMYDSDIDAASTLRTTPVAYSESLIPAVGTIGTNRMLAQNVQDVSATTQLFFNFNRRAVIVNARIFYKGTLRPNVSNTYNFTVTPRG